MGLAALFLAGIKDKKTGLISDRATIERMVESFADSRGMVRLAIAETLGEIGSSAPVSHGCSGTSC